MGASWQPVSADGVRPASLSLCVPLSPSLPRRARCALAADGSGKLQEKLLIADKTQFNKIIVDPSARLIFFKAAKGAPDLSAGGIPAGQTTLKGGLVYAIPFAVLTAGEVTKKILKKHAIKATKGCNVMTIDPHGFSTTASALSKRPKLAVAIGKKLRTFLYTPVNPAGMPGMGSGGKFAKLNDYPLHEHAVILELCRHAGGGGRVLIGLGKQGGFHLLDLLSGHMRALTATSRVDPIMCLELPESRDEFLLV